MGTFTKVGGDTNSATVLRGFHMVTVFATAAAIFGSIKSDFNLGIVILILFLTVVIHHSKKFMNNNPDVKDAAKKAVARKAIQWITKIITKK